MAIEFQLHVIWRDGYAFFHSAICTISNEPCGVAGKSKMLRGESITKHEYQSTQLTIWNYEYIRNAREWSRQYSN